MTQQKNDTQNPPTGDENPEVYSINQDKDGALHLSRKDFLAIGAAIGGTLLVRGVCPRFGTRSAPRKPVQAGMMHVDSVYVHAEPSIASNITDTLRQNDFVRLINDCPDLGWIEIATREGNHGWIKRSFIDFSRAIQSDSPNFNFSSSQTHTQTQKSPDLRFSVTLQEADNHPKKGITTGHSPTCGESILNGDFEAGSVNWVEETSGQIITDQYPLPHQGSWVAWLGGLDYVERLTQLFHVPAFVQDYQKLEFYLRVTSDDPYPQINDTFYLRFLDAGGTPISPDIMIANNTTKFDWSYIFVDINGLTTFVDQDIQIQFVADLDSSYVSNFVLDLVSLDMACDATPTPTITNTPAPMFYIYCPIVMIIPTPGPTATPTSTPSPSATPCPGHDPCPNDCSFDCGGDCTYDCSNDCTFECIYDCTFDCIYDCSFD